MTETVAGEGTAGARRQPMPAALRRRIAVLSVALVAVLGLVAYALVRASGFGSPATASLPAVTSPGFIRLSGHEAPAFALPELDRPGVKVSLADLRGKPLVLNFWSTSCTVCVTEAPALAGAARRLGSGVRLVGIDTAETGRAAGLAFVARYHLRYPMLYDGSAAVAGRYTAGLPVTFFVSPTGKLLAENLGAVTVASLGHEVTSVFGRRA